MLSHSSDGNALNLAPGEINRASQYDAVSRIIDHQHTFYGLPPQKSLDTATFQYFMSFVDYLTTSRRVISLLGAGLSASSGIPTFRGSGRLWRGHECRLLATPGYFNKDPKLVWLFFHHRRHVALKASPNAGHRALAALASRCPESITITQNIDDLSQRAGHPRETLASIHGSLFKVSCTNSDCSYKHVSNTRDPIISSPAIVPDVDYSDERTPFPDISLEQLPHCPTCRTALLRPGVVLFGETLPADELFRIDSWLAQAANVDLMLIVGTSANITPAAEYIDKARSKGARIAIFNVSQDEERLDELGPDDWLFLGDAAVMLPEIILNLCFPSSSG